MLRASSSPALSNFHIRMNTLSTGGIQVYGTAFPRSQGNIGALVRGLPDSNEIQAQISFADREIQTRKSVRVVSTGNRQSERKNASIFLLSSCSVDSRKNSIKTISMDQLPSDQLPSSEDQLPSSDSEQGRGIIPPNETERLRAVQRCEILDTPADGAFDRITALAARVFQVPTAVVSIVDSDRIWFKSRYGLDLPQVPRDTGSGA